MLITEAIRSGRLHKRNISFSEIRRVAGRDMGRKDELKYGHAILQDAALLDQYLYTYGLMIKEQWETPLGGLNYQSTGKMRIVDYGCGQGLAIALLIDNLGQALAADVSDVVLIEPSIHALRRAEQIAHCYCPQARITPINSHFDCIPWNTVNSLESASETIHLFSNVLDIPGFDQFALLGNALSQLGCHQVFAVSDDRKFAGGSDRIITLAQHLRDQHDPKIFAVEISRIDQYSVRHDRMRAISWICKVRVG